MTQRDMAGYLGVATATIRNWKKDKPHLYEIVMKGFAFNEIVEAQKESYERVKELKEKFEVKR